MVFVIILDIILLVASIILNNIYAIIVFAVLVPLSIIKDIYGDNKSKTVKEIFLTKGIKK